MKQINLIVCCLFCAVLSSILFLNPVSARSIQHKNTILNVLEEGQKVTLKELAGKYDIIVIEGAVPVQSHKVVEIADDFLKLQDVVKITEIYIPIYSIKSIQKMNFQR